MTDISAPALARSVLITGASTGIGAAAARHLAAIGWTVFAGVRSEKDASALRLSATGDLRPVPLDVTSAEQVSAAMDAIGTALCNRRLTGLVNNAGIAKMGPLAIQPLDDFEAHFAVNVFGQLRVTQAAVPLLGSDPVRQGPPGRIVTITSVGGRIAAPFLGAYTATKHANEAMTDTLRRELAIYGIDAIAIGPGSVRTPIWDKAEQANESGPYASSDWAKPLKIFEETMLNGGKTGLPPEEIAQVIEKALCHPNPKARYAPVPDKLTNFTIASRLPKRWLDKVFIKRFGLKRR
ncbi:SDR family NAD(P)-dependent oxidoreductase [Hyphomonas sp. WL0036]|uniref:SDR family NAD(P)-dependent oxidoreductase n=1 Tax=Hyphomonas sediminis TaxID=2866160 RepID=UPI001C7ED7B0|nr:SDR family NAD(P)-dependent oxidoreductase [Hyphomonas sediminis]MBY9066113.1 SDR family NAD(P)-dependent oxidoreductase [Hyphomonas sediminis]